MFEPRSFFSKVRALLVIEMSASQAELAELKRNLLLI